MVTVPQIENSFRLLEGLCGDTFPRLYEKLTRLSILEMS